MRITQAVFIPIYGGPILLKESTNQEQIRGFTGFGSTRLN